MAVLLIMLLLLCSPAAAQVQRPQDDPSYQARLNDELRQTNRRLLAIEGGIPINTMTTGILTVDRGGTGQDFSTVTQGSLIMASATGVLGEFGAGPAATFLESQGPGSSLTWALPKFFSNALFQYSGQVDVATVDKGEYAGPSLNPVNGTVTDQYRFLVTTSGQQIWETKWVKISGVSTVTVWCRLWNQASDQAKLTISIGSASGNVTGTNNQTAPEWLSFTIDVSGLTDGTAYDVTATLAPIGGGHGVFCSNIIGFGS